MLHRLRCLELFAGIGGFATAVTDRAEIVAAVDINVRALGVYSHNFSHPTHVNTIESLTEKDYRQWGADLWWMSPPCQPFTSRGNRHDLTDTRTTALIRLIDQIKTVLPRYVALENVAGFCESQTHQRLRDVLVGCGYNLQEIVLCPTQLGIPNRRPRFYLIAARGHLKNWPTISGKLIKLEHFIDTCISPALNVPQSVVEQYLTAISVVDLREPSPVCSCFTSAYGRSIIRSGSYLQTFHGLRRFAPTEILRLLGFPKSYRLPDELTLQQAWRLVGNSVSVATLRYVLAAIPELATPLSELNVGDPLPSLS